MMDRLLEPLLYLLSGLMPRIRRKVVFGAWLGKKFADNPKFLLLYLVRRKSNLDLVWIAEEAVRRTIPANLPVRFVRRASLAAWWEMLTAGTCFVTHGIADLSTFNLMRGARRVYLGHGLAIKHLGSRDTVLRNPVLAALRRMVRHAYSFDHYVASSRAHREKLLVENATCNIAPDQLLECGQPRIDFLVENSDPARAADFRARFLAHYGIPSAGRVITYLPTFRDTGKPVFSFAALDARQRERLDALLTGLNAVLIEKSHFAGVLRGASEGQAKPERVFSLSGSASIDTQELLLVTDILLTDYSGCYVDFLVLHRPILHFAYDRAYYENADRGLYFNLDEVAGGPIVENFDDLCSEIENCTRDSISRRDAQERVRIKLTEFEHGTACEQIARTVLALDPCLATKREEHED